ncbi:MAG TPA: GDSL-type esterase/lipase family protein [Candidatus Polarisedimenticolaceae bacterium]|nr:GDSL-type esterase/lipase family protein [Candidatus Polarisedimenticolaceae bacterium]
MTCRISRLLLVWIALGAVGARAQTGSTSNPGAASMPQWEILRRIDDFGGLHAYAEENAALPAAPANRVVFLGDSITRFWGKKSAFFPGEPYLNRGIEGQTTAQMLVRFRQDVLDLRPAAVVIQGGLADIAGFTGPSSLVEIENNLRSMAELASFNHISPILVGLPPAADYPGRTGPEPVTQIVALNKWIARYCASSHFPFLDYYSALVGGNGQMKEGVSDDGVHPNEKGYALLRPLAERAVADVLKQRAGGASTSKAK